MRRSGADAGGRSFGTSASAEAGANARAAAAQTAANDQAHRRSRDHLPSRRPARRHESESDRSERQGRAAHAAADGPRRLAALRRRDRRGLGQGRRAGPARHRLDHRAGGEVQARHRGWFFRQAGVSRRRERIAWHRRRDPVQRPGPLPDQGRELYDVRGRQRRLVSALGRRRSRSVAARRHGARRDDLFQGGADPVLAVPDVSPFERAEIGIPDAGAGFELHPRLGNVVALLFQPRAELRRDAHAAADDQARAAGQRPVPLSVSRHRRRGRRRSAARPDHQHDPIRYDVQAQRGLQQRAGPRRVCEPAEGLRRYLFRRPLRPAGDHLADQSAARRRIRV